MSSRSLFFSRKKEEKRSDLCLSSVVWLHIHITRHARSLARFIMPSPTADTVPETGKLQPIPADTDTDTKSDHTTAVASPGEKTDDANNNSNNNDEKTANDSNPTEPTEDESNYPHGFRLALIILALCIAVFLVALDQTIIAPALGAITGQFQSTGDIGWCKQSSTSSLPGADVILFFWLTPDGDRRWLGLPTHHHGAAASFWQHLQTF